jgi:translation initiation factor IF-2
MSETAGTKRLNAVVKELNVGMTTLVDFLGKKGHVIEAKPTSKLTEDQYNILLSEYSSEMKVRQEANKLGKERSKPKDVVHEIAKPKPAVVEEEEEEEERILIKSGLVNTAKKVEDTKPQVEETKPKEVAPAPVSQTPPPPPEPVEDFKPPVLEEKPLPPPTPVAEVKTQSVIEAELEKDDAQTFKVIGKIDLDAIKKPKSKDKKDDKKSAQQNPVAQQKKEVKQTSPTQQKVQEKEKIKENKETPAPKTEKATETLVTPEVINLTPPSIAADTVIPEEEAKAFETKYEKLEGLKVMGKIELRVDPPKKAQPVASSDNLDQKKKRKRKPIPGQTQNPNQGNNNNQGNNQGGYNNRGGQGNNNQGGQNRGPGGNNQGGQNRPGGNNQGGQNRGPGGTNQGGQNRPGGTNQGGQNRGPGGNNQGGPNRPGGNNFNRGGNNYNRGTGNPPEKTEVSEKEIQDKLKATLARLNPGSKNPNIGAVRSKIRKQKRDHQAAEREEAAFAEQQEQNKLKVTEFVTANELAKMMNLQITQIISACMSLGMMVSINQRLDAETIAIVAEEFGYEVEFVSAEVQEAVEEEIDDPETLLPRAPIVTVMGHVDHGKTSLLDFIRKANVISGEAGGTTQHIGAYEVKLENGKKITFLDTPGHEAFTAMRARGAKITDIVIIVIAADDSVMPQTKEAISHAQAAGVPIVFAINKIDREGANPDKIREQLSAMNILVEEWGGKFQCQEISAKKGLNIELLLEKVLLEAEMLELKANPDKRAIGSVIESTLDKGRGIVTTVMVQSGTMQVGDPLLAGIYSGKVKAMFDERGKKMLKAGPSTPVVILGFDGAPQAGDKFIITKNDQEAREISTKRQQLQREQGIRTHKHITLDEIGRRLAIGNFKELKVIVKGDVDGSVEALSDSLIKQSTEEVQVTVIYKGVGQISESDVMLASASDAIIVGFQVRPSPQARKLAETESIDIRLYSIIYKAIEEIKGAIEGLLAPKMEEKILGNAEIREVYKITKVGAVAGCMVTDGKIPSKSKVRLIRDGVVVYSGNLSSLKRFKDDVKEVSSGYDCGLTINNYNDLRIGDFVEAYDEVEVKRTLK